MTETSPQENTIVLELTPDQARRHIHALSAHARDLANTDSTRAKANELDDQRHHLEQLLDQATDGGKE